MRTAIIGLGNPLRGDDGVGLRVVEELRRRGLPEGVVAIEGGNAGLDLLDELEKWERVIIVDAAKLGLEPGKFVRFTAGEVKFQENGFSSHRAGLGEVLSLAQALGRRLPEIVVFGVQPADMGWREGLSQEVEAAIPALSDAVLAEVKRQEAID
ncbi:MAG: hydrogenase maturation protease [Anaerolineae bacterium]|nr:hydrogenase maturation protease [Anaerolineae bacterium]